MNRLAAFLASPLLFLSPLALAKEPLERFLIGNPDDALIETAGSGLMLMGGGGDVDEAFRWFLKEAAGGDIIVLRASGGDGYNDYLYRELGETVDSVETFVTRNRAAAFDPALPRAIESAEAIFIAGGDQSKYVSFWKDTPVQSALNQHLKAGKPLGGTSAGLAIMGQYAYSAMHKGDLTSKLALSDPHHEYITIEQNFLQAPLLKGILTDSHFSERDRLGRLIVMLLQPDLAANSHDPIGMGVDERTALIVDRTGRGTVLSQSNGLVHIVTLLSPRQPTIEGAAVSIISLDANSQINLANRSIDNAFAIHSVRIENGRIVDTTTNP